MTPLEPFVSLGLAGAAGLLIGLERERSAPEVRREGSFLGGARTHPLLALAGGVATLAARQVGAVAVAVPFLGLVALLVIGYAGDVVRDRTRGITSEAAFLLSFLLGVLSATEGLIEPLSAKIFVVSAVAVLATFLLSAKPMLHPLVRRVSPEDALATLEFLIVAVVVLPLLPDRTYGPLDVLNPFQIGAMVVLISALSFCGFAAMRLLGPERGMGLTGLVGGLASSTAVTLAMSGRAREHPALSDSFALAVMLASTVMFLRVLVIVALVNPGLAGPLLLPLLAGAGAAGLASLLLWRRSRRPAREAGPVEVTNPFELGKALRFALLFAVVLLGATAATRYLGTAGTYAAGLLAGTTDVDAITLSMAKLGGTAVDARVAVTTVFLGVASNTLVKGGMAGVVGGWAFGRRVLAAQVASLLAGVVGLAAAWVL
ncbi:MAG TPA: MgtC/SapB family protein [Anaeromyxobacter sp.]|nr:MgtC/SapB family protein [Anaeromyxobacter sp.]